jgi:protein required for attachment to host cells
MDTTWIIVMDGAQARILETKGRDPALRVVWEGDALTRGLSGRGLVSDRPGRTFDRHGKGRHAMEAPTDPQRHAKFVFARELATKLRTAFRKHRFNRLVLAAPPQTMGDLRASLARDVANSIEAEILKDLVHVPVKDLPSHLAAK